MKNKTIEVKCTGTDRLDYSLIVEFQGDLKKRTSQDIEKIKASIIKYGFTFPFFIWKHGKKNYCLDGHGRLKALHSLKKDGYSIPDLPIAIIQAKDEAEAKKKLLQLNSQYGTMSKQSVLDFVGDIQIDMNEFSLQGIDFELKNPYTTKIKSPIYKPSDKKPEIKTLVNRAKTRQLIERIEKSGVTEAEKDFLIAAAQRHLVFNYQLAADLYAHSGKEMQELMEDSALVIIDYEKAIEKGYVQVVKSLKGIQAKDE